MKKEPEPLKHWFLNNSYDVRCNYLKSAAYFVDIVFNIKESKEDAV